MDFNQESATYSDLTNLSFLSLRPTTQYKQEMELSFCLTLNHMTKASTSYFKIRERRNCWLWKVAKKGSTK